MFTPLNLRRLACLLSVLFFGLSLATWPDAVRSELLVIASILASLASLILRFAFGPEVEPLVPPLRLRERLTSWYVALGKGDRLLVLAVAAVATFLLAPPLIRVVYPGFAAFGPDTLNAYTLGAAQYFLALLMAYIGWRWLFPGLYAYAVETMEGKLLEKITADLLAHVGSGTTSLLESAERRKIATLQFTIRCVRFLFSVSPFVFFFWQANAALTAALTAVPA